MQTVNYILVNETSTQNAVSNINGCHLPDIGHCVIVDARNLEQRGALIRELCRLRRRYPDAKILGISEVGDYSVHPSDRMNQIRRAMSDLLF